METEESSVSVSGASAGDFFARKFIENDRLGFQQEGKDTEDNYVVRWWWRRSEWRRRALRSSAVDMTTSRSCRCGVSATALLWVSLCLVLLLGEVSCVSEEQTRFSRSPKYQEQETEVPGGLSMQESYNVMQFIRELIQRQQQRANQHAGQAYNGEELNDREIDWRKVPFPLLYQLRSMMNDGSKEEDKRGSYMSLCHFKICNLG